MKVKMVFLDWKLKGKSIYSTEVGNELSKGDFHSGTTFEGEIFLGLQKSEELKNAILQGFQPCFWLILDHSKEGNK